MKRLVVLISIVLLCPSPLTGCVVDTEDPGEAVLIDAAEDADEFVGAGTQELVTGGEFSWYQGWSEVPMGSSSGQICFLTHIQGKFSGSGEAVWVRNWNGSWWLGGNSYQEAVGARARCIAVSSYSTYYDWYQGNLPTWMGSAHNRSCFLTRVSGHFEGQGEYVAVYPSGDSWWIGGNSYQDGVMGRARCVDLPGSGLYTWWQGWEPVLMERTDSRACFLTRMGGKFKGAGETISVFSSGGWWYLTGTSYQQDVHGQAWCL